MKGKYVQLIVATLFLCLGILVYLADRQQSDFFLLPGLVLTLPVFENYSPIFYGIATIAPSYFHTVAFSIVSAFFVEEKKNKVIVCFIWLVINMFLEVCQLLEQDSAEYFTGLLEDSVFITWIWNSFAFGVFDYQDIMAITLGFISALAIIGIRKTETSKDETYKSNPSDSANRHSKADLHINRNIL